MIRIPLADAHLLRCCLFSQLKISKIRFRPYKQVKSSQVKLLISIGTNKCAKQRAQHNKTKNAACDALMKLQI